MPQKNEIKKLKLHFNGKPSKSTKVRLRFLDGPLFLAHIRIRLRIHTSPNGRDFLGK